MFRSHSPSIISDIRHRSNIPRPSSTRSDSPCSISSSPPHQHLSTQQSNQPALPPSNISYHDIRLHTAHKNTIIIKGSINESDPVSLSGHVVFSLLEKTAISSVSLNFIGTYNIHFVENFQTSSGKILTTCPFVEKSTILHCDWENLLTSADGKILMNQNDSNNYTPLKPKPVHSNSTSQLYNNFNNYQTFQYDAAIPVGETPFSNLSHSNTKNTVFELPPGNYSLPFKITLPGNTPETFESMKTVSVVYRLESKINSINKTHGIINEQTTLHNTFKYIRVLRTMSGLQLALNEEFLAENSWTHKLQYKIRIPRKIIPNGSTLKIYMLIIPIMKKLSLGKITIQIAQCLKFNSLKPNDFGEKAFTDEKIIYQHSLPVIPQSQLPHDVWALEASLPTSNILRNISQDYESVSNLISVKHKLIIFINLINPDGHISQIKSKIPLGFYIKPNSKVYGKNVNIDKQTGDVKFAPGKNLIFDLEYSGSDNGTHFPELLVCPCDLINPDSFLFNDNSYTIDDSALTSTTGSQLALNTMSQMCECPNNCNTNCEVPPTYKESANDSLFESNQFSECASPIVGSPQLTPNLEDSISSAASSILSRSIKIDDDVPSYKKVFDDDVSDIGEPAPLYEESSTSTMRSLLSAKHKSRPRASTSPSLLRSSVDKRYTESNRVKSQNLHINTHPSNITLSRPSSPLLSLSLSSSSLVSMNRQNNTHNNNIPPNNTNTNANNNNLRISVKRALSSTLLNNKISTSTTGEKYANDTDGSEFNEHHNNELHDNENSTISNKSSSERRSFRSRMDKSGMGTYFSNGLLSSSGSDIDLIGV